MKLPLNWLNSYFKDAITTQASWDDVLYKLTMAGLEVESITEVCEDSGASDKVLELKITPNRGDCLSVLGILREVAVLTDSKINLPPQATSQPSETSIDKIAVRVHDTEKCPNYLACVIKGVNNQAQLPQEMIRRLELSGIRSVSPVVDITNYVMLELGQPLHAFDLAKVGDLLQVRLANADEKIKLLDGQEVHLTDNTLIICDANNRVAAIAGIMGGVDSGVIANTQDVVLESAFFIPEIIAGKAKHYGVTSDSAYRFERGVDPEIQELAIKYAATLIAKYCGGQIGTINATKTPYIVKTMNLKYDSLTSLLGIQLPNALIDDVLGRAGFKYTKKGDNSFTVQVPSHRFDINIAEDIVEEVARIYGYDNIQPIMPQTHSTMEPLDQNILYQQNLKTKLVNLGYNEIVSYAFLEDKFEDLYGFPGLPPVLLQNPIAGLSVMRTSLIANLLKSLEANLNRGHKMVRIFELARVFHGESENSQPLKLAGLIYGNYQVVNWANIPARPIDFYDIKHDVEDLLSGISGINFVPCGDYPLLHGGRCAKINAENRGIGVIGQLHPKYLAQLGTDDLPYVFELDITTISQIYLTTTVVVKEVSRFQKVERDLAFLLEAKLNVGLILDAIWQANIPYLSSINVFDVYQGDNLPLNSKSVAINFLFQGNKTLNDDEVNASIENVISLVKDKFLAVLR